MKSTRVFPRELTMFCQKRQPRTLGIAVATVQSSPRARQPWLLPDPKIGWWTKYGMLRGLKECQDIWWHLEMYIALVILSLPLDVFITFGYNHVQDLAVLWHIRHSETICHLQGSYPKNKHDCLMVHRNCGLVHPVGLVQVWLGWTNPTALEKPFEYGDL